MGRWRSMQEERMINTETWLCPDHDLAAKLCAASSAVVSPGAQTCLPASANQLPAQPHACVVLLPHAAAV